MAAPARLVVGRVLRPHGLRGEVTVEVLSDAPERFSPGAELGGGDVDAPEALRRLEVADARLHQGRLLLRFVGVEDRDAAGTLRGLLLSIPAETARPLAPDEFWPHQLVGLTVVDSEGRERGAVADVLPGAAHDLLEVRLAGEEAGEVAGPGRGGRTALVPAVAALVKVELDAGRVVIQALPGLLDPE